MLTALARYGRHEHPCAGVWYKPPERAGKPDLRCTCGLDEALSEASEVYDDHPPMGPCVAGTFAGVEGYCKGHGRWLRECRILREALA